MPGVVMSSRANADGPILVSGIDAKPARQSSHIHAPPHAWSQLDEKPKWEYQPRSIVKYKYKLYLFSPGYK